MSLSKKPTYPGLPAPELRLCLVILAGLAFLAGLVVLAGDDHSPAMKAGSVLCHQIDVRSFFSGEHQFPLCQRCIALYVSFLAGITWFILSYRGKRFVLPGIALVAGGFACMVFLGIDGVNSWTAGPDGRGLFGYASSALTRVVTGTLGGFAASFIFPVLTESAKDTRPQICLKPRDVLLPALLTASLSLVLWFFHGHALPAWIIQAMGLAGAGAFLLFVVLWPFRLLGAFRDEVGQRRLVPTILQVIVLAALVLGLCLLMIWIKSIRSA